MTKRRKKGNTDQHWLIGFHAVESALDNDPSRIVEVIFEKGNSNPRLRQLRDAIGVHQIACREGTRDELDQRSEKRRHQGVAARYTPPQSMDEKSFLQQLKNAEQPPLVLVADGVQDPHNLGAILRTSDAAGVAGVVVPRDRAVGLTPTVCKVASGAADSMPLIRVVNLARSLDHLKDAGLWVIGTSDQAQQSIFDVDLSGPVALVVGQEGTGMRRLTTERCDQRVRLPMAGTVSSLNVSVATGICLFEAVRQRAAQSRGFSDQSEAIIEQ